MPELPEVEITCRLLSEATEGKEIESVRVAGFSTLKSFDPPTSALHGERVVGIVRRGKHLIVNATKDLSILLHLMSAGRFQLFDKPATPRDRTSRLLIRLEGGLELRLREFGTHQSAWAKVLPTAQIENDEAIATLGPEAWPEPPPLNELLVQPRPLHGIMRDQRVIAGVGRSWVDEILHAAMLSPFKRGSDLTDLEGDVLRAETFNVLDNAIRHYEKTMKLPIPDKLPMPLKVHKHVGEPCPRCGEAIAAVNYESYVMCYCPVCQTGGKVLKDRRLSRLLK